MIDNEQVKYDEAQSYSRSINALYHLVSAKSNYGIENALQKIIQEILRMNDFSSSIYKRRSQPVVLDDKKPNENKQCC